MRVLVGTSGYSYKEWKGPFYPEKLAAREFLHFYAEHLPTVEINNTFYRMPSEKVVVDWAMQVPQAFSFALKAPQRITHQKRLRDAAEPLEAFLRLAGVLGDKLGSLLFQLPPNMKKDVPRLDNFLTLLPSGLRVAFEFRHDSWFDDEVFETLRTHRAALCAAESEEIASPLVATTDWGYVRLRRAGYGEADLERWAKKILACPWNEAFVYMKHDEGDAPRMATTLLRYLQ
jgi:uncharacterized protein YecE (DUF72 family)